MQNVDTIVILDFGSQVTQLIARRIRSKKIHAEILPFNTPISELDQPHIKGIIFSGGPASVIAKGSPKVDPKVFELGKPILGICYGLQLITHTLGGKVGKVTTREYGKAILNVKAKRDKASLFTSTPPSQTVWMSHGDTVTAIPKGFKVEATSHGSPFAAIADRKKQIYGIQFHAEVTHTDHGVAILDNFANGICGARRQWSTKRVIDDSIDYIRETVGKQKVIHAVSGGVDSTVLALVLKQALPQKQIENIFIDHGLGRLGEVEEVMGYFKKLKLKVTHIDASKQFLKTLKGVTDPERKRKIIGKKFIDVLMKNVHKKDMLSQGTLYPDVIESVSVKGPSDTIKTHHNRAPEVLKLLKQNRVVEPFKELFKDEVRAVGKELGMPDEIVWRHPFPGPGLGIRILGDITDERLEIVRQADKIFLDEIKTAGLYRKISQAFAALDTSRAVGVKGDEREFGYMILLRAVVTTDFMTADWFAFEPEFLQHVSSRIVNEVPGVTRVLYDVTQKPPGTICFM